MAKPTAPAKSATQDDDKDLPQTAVKPRGKDLLIQSLQSRLAEYAEPEELPAAEPTVTQSTVTQSTNTEEETFKKRYGDLRRHAQQKETRAAEQINDLKNQLAQLSAASNQPMPKTKEEFEAWKAKYPDIVGFIEIIAEERASAAKQQLQEELGSVKQKLTETEKEKGYATLKSLVPNIEDIVASAGYKTWFNNQPAFVQEELNTSDDPYRIAYFMNVYAHTLQRPTTKQDNKLQALETQVKNTGITPANTKWKFTQSQISKMQPEEFEKMEDEIITARNAGLILDDVSRRNTVFDT